MSHRVAIVGLVSLLGAAVSLQADVAPFPSWRVVANGAIAQAVQAGDAIYLGGAFTKIGRGITPFDGVLDPATLTLTEESGCARIAGSAVQPTEHRGRYIDHPPDLLADGAGPFPVVPNTALVRLGSDCRFDRRFRTILSNVIVGRVVDAGSSVFAEMLYYTAFPITNENSVNVVVELNGQTGAMRRYWPGDLALVGLGPDGRLLASRAELNGNRVIGWFDQTSGDLVPGYTVPGSSVGIAVVGSVVMISRGVSNGYEYTALDAATLAPLPAWPQVSAFAGAQVFAAGAGRIFIAGSGLKVDGLDAPQILAFDAVTGARAPGWAAPAWMDDSRSTFLRLHVAAGRLVVLGDFAPGAPRDTLAALDAVTGTLDPWDPPFAVGYASLIEGRMHFRNIGSTNRVTRDRLAAVDASTGAPLPWTAGAPSPLRYVEVTALAADAGYLYAGWSGAARRYGLASGTLDPSWQLDLTPQVDALKGVSAIAIDQGNVFVTGSFDRARDGAAAPWQPREGGAAMTAAGTLTSWRPRIEALCITGGRFSFSYPCIGQMAISEGRVFLQGSLQRLDAPAEPRRSLVAVTADTGALDPLVPFVPLGAVTAITAGPTALFAATAFAGERQLARVDTASGPQLVVSLGPYPIFAPAQSWLASRDARLYADVERDAASGRPTGNPVLWRRPNAVGGGVVDIEPGSPTWAAAWYTAAAPVAPAAPTGLAADLNGDRLTVRWSRGAGDLRPLVAPPSSGGTAATSHVISVSLAPGGPAMARVDTASPDTSYTVAAPSGTFYLRVQAVNASGASPLSADLRVDVRPSAPESPIATLAVATGRHVRVEWQAPPHGWPATGYLIEAGSSPGAADLGVAPLNGLEFQAAAVPSGRYYLRVRAVNAAGTSPPGEEVVVDVGQ